MDQILNYLNKSQISDKSKTLYANNISRVIKALNIEPDQIIDKKDEIYNYLVEKYPNSNTRRNYLAAFSAISTMTGNDESAIKFFNDKVQELNNQYSDQNSTGIISDKQKPSFEVGIDGLHKLIDTLRDMPNKTNGQKTALLCYQILMEIPLRNELASLEFIRKSIFDKLSYEKRRDRNFIVTTMASMEMVRYAYKTGKTYGEIRTPISEYLRQKLLLYKIDVGIGPLFRDGSGNRLTNQQLAELLFHTSKKILGVPVSTTLFTKIRLSHQYAESVDALKNEAANRGHSTGVQQSVYIKKLE